MWMSKREIFCLVVLHLRSSYLRPLLFLLITYFWISIYSGKPTDDKNLILAEFGSLQLEMVRLSQLTGEKRYAELANNVIYAIDKVATPFPGVYPIMWDLDSFSPSSCKYAHI